MSKQKPSQIIRGKITINAKQLLQASAVEITPGGNGVYAITIRSIVDHVPEMFLEDFKGKLHIAYSNEYMDTPMRFEAVFLDFGLEDTKDNCILSLFFRGTQEASPIITATKPSLTLA